MDKSTRGKFFTDDQIIVGRSSQRRWFLRSLGGGGFFTATGVAAGIRNSERAEAYDFDPLWDSAQVLIGNSPADQSPSRVIECPLFFENGHFAKGFHTLDLSNLTQVRGTITIRNKMIEPDFGPSVAAAPTLGTDGIPYLVVAGQGTVTGGRGYFRGVTNAIIRCQYKVADLNSFLLIACVHCVIILVRPKSDDD